MMHIRVRYEKLGGHVHCRVFSAPSGEVTHAKNGELVFDECEWPDALKRLSMWFADEVLEEVSE